MVFFKFCLILSVCVYSAISNNLEPGMKMKAVQGAKTMGDVSKMANPIKASVPPRGSMQNAKMATTGTTHRSQIQQPRMMQKRRQLKTTVDDADKKKAHDEAGKNAIASRDAIKKKVKDDVSKASLNVPFILFTLCSSLLVTFVLKM